MNEVEEYLLKFKDEKRDILFFLHSFFIEKYKLAPKLSYGVPFYYRNRWVVYLNPDNVQGVELAFPNGHLFTDQFSALKSKGRKMVRSVELHSLDDIDTDDLQQFLDAAIEIDNRFKKK